MKKSLAIALAAALSVCMTGCGDEKEETHNYADGTYTAQSSEYINDEDDSTAGNGYGVISITIKDNSITDCTFETYELGGKLKDEDYGKENGEIANRDFYNKAQKALAACDVYAEQLVKKGKLSEVDAVSGATVNYNEFKEAAEIALKDAQTD